MPPGKGVKISEDFESALIVGGDGLIGSYLSGFLLKLGVLVDLTSRRTHGGSGIYLDLSDSRTFSNIPAKPYEFAVVAAGLSSVAACEHSPDLSYLVNVSGRLGVVNPLVEAGTRVISFSSDAVFSGDSPVLSSHQNPDARSVYGKHMAEFEREMIALGPLASVTRLGKVFHPRLPILSRWIRSLSAGEGIVAAEDLCTAPISFELVSDALELVLREKIEGLIHASSYSEISWYGIAKMVARALGKDENLVTGVSARDLQPAIVGKLHAVLPDTHYLGSNSARGEIAVSRAIQGAIELLSKCNAGVANVTDEVQEI